MATVIINVPLRVGMKRVCMALGSGSIWKSEGTAANIVGNQVTRMGPGGGSNGLGSLTTYRVGYFFLIGPGYPPNSSGA